MDLWPSLISLAGVVIGWFLVHQLAVYRERNAEWRRLAHSTANEIETIEDLALRYHKKAERDLELEEDIIKRLDRAEIKTLILSRHLESIDRRCLLPFHKAITLKNFQTNRHTSHGADTGIYKEIIAATSTVLEELYSAH